MTLQCVFRMSGLVQYKEKLEYGESEGNFAEFGRKIVKCKWRRQKGNREYLFLAKLYLRMKHAFAERNLRNLGTRNEPSLNQEASLSVAGSHSQDRPWTLVHMGV